jgi:hypothetical protein
VELHPAADCVAAAALARAGAHPSARIGGLRTTVRDRGGTPAGSQEEERDEEAHGETTRSFEQE